MKSESEISLDFKQSIKRAEELENVASDMRKLANDELGNTLNELSAAWRGEAAGSFMNKGAILQEKINKSASNLQNIAATIRSVAKRTYDAEMRALQIARERTYGGGGANGSR